MGLEMLAQCFEGRKPLSDEEIFKMAVEDWTSVLISLWTAFDKPLDKALLEEYRIALAFVPLGLLEQVVAKCKAECKFFPRIAEVRLTLRRILNNPHDLMDAIDIWAESH